MPPTSSDLIRRHLAARVSQSLKDTPAVLVNGPRQCGKTTLVKLFSSGVSVGHLGRPRRCKILGGMTYLTLDDPAVLKQRGWIL